MHFDRTKFRTAAIFFVISVATLSALPVHAQRQSVVAVRENKSRLHVDDQTLEPKSELIDLTMYERIRAEATDHGHAMEFASALSDGIGPRLTGSPNMMKANLWARDALTKVGLYNAHLEDWGEFGMGWSQVNAWARLVSPDTEPIWLQAAVWSVSTPGPITGEIVYLSLNDAARLDAVRGTLKGKIILLGAIPPIPELNEPLSFRYTDDELQELEGPNAPRRPVGPQ